MYLCCTLQNSSGQVPLNICKCIIGKSKDEHQPEEVQGKERHIQVSKFNFLIFFFTKTDSP